MSRPSSWIRPLKRKALYERDDYRCVYCEVEVIEYGPNTMFRNKPSSHPPDHATLDHIDPNGGHDTYNLVTCCKQCNDRKKDTPVREFVTNWFDDVDAVMARVQRQRRKRWKRILNRLRFERDVEREIQRRVDAGQLVRVSRASATVGDEDIPF